MKTFLRKNLGFEHGWTGGQYSVVRAMFGLYLCVHFVHLVPWAPELFSSAGALPEASASPFAAVFPNVLAVFDPPWFATALVVFGAAASLAFAAGVRDRIFAVLIWYVWACLFGRNPLISNPSLAFVGWMLLMHALIPAVAYGAWSARGRVDPRGSWRFPRSFFGVAWIVMAAGYTYSGITKLVSPSWIDGTAVVHVLESPLARVTPLRELLLGMPDAVTQVMTWSALGLELLALPLALVARFRAWLWLALVGLHAGILATVAFSDLTLGMLMIHLITFNPDWIKRARSAATERIFYDGGCGLCHRAVRFVLSEDDDSAPAFRFAPLARLGRVAPDIDIDELPDSIVVLTDRGEVLTRTDAVVHILRRFGGLWRLLATALAVVPRPVRDAAYDAIAAIRHRLFDKPTAACPILPPDLRQRFAAPATES